MNFPRQASVRMLAALAIATLAAAPLWRASAQSAPTRASSPNGKIVFQSTQGGDGFTSDIYVMDADGKHQTRLTDNTAADDANPIWSPKGDQIAFLSDRNGGSGNYEIFLMNADGTNQRPLRTAANGGPVYGANIEWSPDGTRLKYESFGFDLGNIYVIQVVAPGGGDSVLPPQLVNPDRPAGTTDSEASWSPDGTKFVFRHIACDFCLLSELYTMNVDGTNRVQVTNLAGVESSPRWSPDGTRVAYEADRGGAAGVYVKNADGTGAEVNVGGMTAGRPVWSPDGSRIAFVSDAGNVYTAGPDGANRTLLTDVLANGGGGIFWSPDGSKVAFHNVTGNSTAVDLYVVNADGSRRATNYTKTRRDDEFAFTWQKLSQ